MKLASLLTLLFILCCVRESIQYGTIFTDNITPAFSNSTYFKGIKTVEAFTTDSDVGIIAATNLLGFRINSPGGVTATSNTLSLSTSQGIAFGDGKSVQVNSGGTFNVVGQRTGINANSLSFTGAGDVNVGGLDSTIRGREFDLNGSHVSLTSTGDILRFNAPVSFEVTAGEQADLNAVHNIAIISDSASIFSVSDELLFSANHIDLDGSAGFTANITGDINFTAASIVDFLPVGDFLAELDDVSVTVSSGDIQLIATNKIDFSGSSSNTDFSFVAQDNTFFSNTLNTDSVTGFVVGGEFSVSADQKVVIANFIEDSDLSFASQTSIVSSAKDLSFTTVHGEVLAGSTLRATSSGAFSINVPGEDLTITAIKEDISFKSVADDFVLDTNEFYGAAEDIYMQTTNDINISAGNVLFRQDTPDSPTGNLEINIAKDLVANVDSTYFETTGEHLWTIGGDASVTVTEGEVEFIADKGYLNDLTFNTGGDVFVNTENSIDYNAELIGVFTTDYLATPESRFSMRTFLYAPLNIFVDGDSLLTQKSLAITSVEDGITTRVGADASFTATTDITHNSFSFNIQSGDTLSFASPNIQVSAGTHFTAEGNRDVAYASDQFSLQASENLQILADQFELRTAGAKASSLTAGEAIYFSQNLPGDSFKVDASSLKISGSYVDFASGDDLFVTVQNDININGKTSFYNALHQFKLDANTIDLTSDSSIDVSSGGGIFAEIHGDIQFSTDQGQLTIDGPRGPFGRLSFVSGSASLQANSVGLTAENFLSDVASQLNFKVTKQLEFKGTRTDPVRSKWMSDDTITFRNQATSVNSNFVNFYAGDDILLDGNTFKYTATNAIRLTTPLWEIVNFDNVNINTQGVATFQGNNFTTTVGGTESFDASGELSIFSGGFIDFTVGSKVDITSPILNIVSPDLFDIEAGAELTFDFTNEFQILSGGASYYNFGGPLTYSSGSESSFSGGYVDILASQISLNTEQNEFVVASKQGDVWFYTIGDTQLNVGGTQSYTGGDVLLNTQLRYVPTGGSTDNEPNYETKGFSASGPGIVLDALQSSISIQTAGRNDYISEFSFLDIVGAGGVLFRATNDINVNVKEDFDLNSVSNTLVKVVGQLTYTAASTGSFQAETSINVVADGSFTFAAAKNFLAASSEQGVFEIVSKDEDSRILTATADFQRWKTAGDFAVQSRDGDVSFSSTATDIVLKTIGGPVLLESKNGGSLSHTVGNNLNLISGDDTVFSSTSTQSWVSEDQIRNFAKSGDIFFDGADSGSYRFESTVGNNVWNAEGSRNPTDGIQLDSELLIQTAGTSANYNPFNTLLFGGETHPDVLISTGGSATTTGFSLDSEGNIFTHSAGSTSFAPAGQYYLNVFKNIESTSGTLYAIQANNGALSVQANAGSVHFHGDSFSSIAQNGYQVTATSGVFEIHSDSPLAESNVQFQSTNQMNMNANQLIENSGSILANLGDARLFTTAATKFVSTEGDHGSLVFAAAVIQNGPSGDVGLTAKSAINFQGLGQDGSILVQGGAIELLTKTTSDITLHAANRFESYSGTDTSYQSGTQLSIVAKSLNGDYSAGNIHFLGKATLDVTAVDTIEFSADRSMSFLATDESGYFNVESTGDVLFSSFDDTVVYFQTLTGSFKNLLFENSLDGSGDVNIITERTPDKVVFAAGDDITWNAGQSVLGHATKSIEVLTNSADGQNRAIQIQTFAKGADIHIDSIATTFLALGDELFQSAGPLEVNSDKHILFQGNSPDDNGNSLTFNSENGDVQLSSTFADIAASAEDSIVATATKNLFITANGLNRDSHAAILVVTDSGATEFNAENTVTVQAFDSVELYAIEGVLNIGVPRFFTDFSVDLDALEQTTKFVSTGHNADIVINTREPLDGLGNLRILAGTAQPLFDDTAATSTVNFISTRSIRFEQVTGFTIGSAFRDQAIRPLFPSDVFFEAYDENASIEVSTSPDALFGNIVMNASSLILEAETKLTLRGAAPLPSGASVVIRSLTEAVTVRSESANSEDGISVTGYNGDVLLEANGNGDILMSGERNLEVRAVKGFNVQASNFYSENIDGTTFFRSESGPINFKAGERMTFDGGDYEVEGYNYFAQAQGDVRVVSDSVTVIVQSMQNIYFKFKNAFNFDVDELHFAYPSSLTIPMRESQVATSQPCFNNGELVISRNQDFTLLSPYSNDGFAANQYFSEADNDSGVSLCLCTIPIDVNPANAPFVWFCRRLSNAQPGDYDLRPLV